MARISIVTSGHLSTSPRVWREADALAAGGHEVTVIGVWFDPKQAEIDKQMLSRRSWVYQAAADLRSRSLWHRGRARLGRTLLAGNVRDPYALGYAVDRVLTSAIKQKADLTITHLEVAMWVGTKLHKRGFRVGVDIEDWYSESRVETNVPRSRFLRALEQKILNRSVHATTTSHAMADALAARYQCRKPKVIYNSVPSFSGSGSAAMSSPIRLIWFSQTLGRDRGLQDVFAALPLLKGEWTLELRANASSDIRSWVDSQVAPALRPKVCFEPTVPPEQLSCVVAKCDIGLAPDPPSCGNKALTIANKIFEYMQCGLSVVASDTPGQREILTAFPQGGCLYSSGDASSLADILNYWLNDPVRLKASKQPIASEANQRFAYERQAKTLLDSVNRGLEC
jgi:glycosyltransferase involved in cell wall biosynthesis